MLCICSYSLLLFSLLSFTENRLRRMSGRTWTTMVPLYHPTWPRGWRLSEYRHTLMQLHIHTHPTHLPTHTHAQTHTSTHPHTCTDTHTYSPTHMHTHTLPTHTHAHTHPTHSPPRTCTHTHTLPTHPPTHMHTHTPYALTPHTHSTPFLSPFPCTER